MARRHLGEADALLAHVPEIGPLVEALIWCVVSADPKRAVDYATTGHTDSRQRSYDEGAATRRRRRQLQIARSRLAQLTDQINAALDGDNTPHCADSRASCHNRSCTQHRKPLRFGARFCDKCGTPANEGRYTDANRHEDEAT